ncbi:MAG: hypothetical protein RBG13Loki_2083 [Promethearchaeota archaeon CR_4]|nr:MAG: hypothetical protein RBG13Loki_2083 [Candidatus Lokiarchaeota archaeon CR_4]
MPGKVCRWRVTFDFIPPKILVSRIKNVPDVLLITTDEGERKWITSIEMITPELSFTEALISASETANHYADFISFAVNYGVSCTIRQINEVGEGGKPKQGGTIKFLECRVVTPENIDLTKYVGNEVYRRQFAHYRKGLSSTDVVERIREFFIVLEDSYPKNDPRLTKWAWVRNLVSHHELIVKGQMIEAEKLIGKHYFDPSTPQDENALHENAVELKKEAKECLEPILPKT